MSISNTPKKNTVVFNGNNDNNETQTPKMQKTKNSTAPNRETPSPRRFRKPLFDDTPPINRYMVQMAKNRLNTSQNYRKEIRNIFHKSDQFAIFQQKSALVVPTELTPDRYILGKFNAQPENIQKDRGISRRVTRRADLYDRNQSYILDSPKKDDYDANNEVLVEEIEEVDYYTEDQGNNSKDFLQIPKKDISNQNQTTNSQLNENNTNDKNTNQTQNDDEADQHETIPDANAAGREAEPEIENDQNQNSIEVKGNKEANTPEVILEEEEENELKGEDAAYTQPNAERDINNQGKNDQNAAEEGTSPENEQNEANPSNNEEENAGEGGAAIEDAEKDVNNQNSVEARGSGEADAPVEIQEEEEENELKDEDAAYAQPNAEKDVNNQNSVEARGSGEAETPVEIQEEEEEGELEGEDAAYAQPNAEKDVNNQEENDKNISERGTSLENGQKEADKDEEEAHERGTSLENGQNEANKDEEAANVQEKGTSLENEQKEADKDEEEAHERGTSLENEQNQDDETANAHERGASPENEQKEADKDEAANAHERGTSLENESNKDDEEANAHERGTSLEDADHANEPAILEEEDEGSAHASSRGGANDDEDEAGGELSENDDASEPEVRNDGGHLLDSDIPVPAGDLEEPRSPTSPRGARPFMPPSSPVRFAKLDRRDASIEHTGDQLLEVSVRPYLFSLSKKYGTPIRTLRDVPAMELNDWESMGFDWVWLYGAWETGAAVVEYDKSDAHLRFEYGEYLPDWEADDVVGYPLCIAKYEVAKEVGSAEDLAWFRAELRKRGMRLMLDFVPNDTAIDAPEMAEHPDFYIRSAVPVDSPDFDPLRFNAKHSGVAFGAGRNMPPMRFNAQLNILNKECREYQIDRMVSVSSMCDGLRVHLAQYLINSEFQEYWKDDLQSNNNSESTSGVGVEFWKEAISRIRKNNPGFVLVAESYIDTLQDVLIDCGFNYVYEKELLDKLVASDVKGFRELIFMNNEHITSKRMVHFVENHDEQRVLRQFFNNERMACAASAALLTLPGLRLFNFHQWLGYANQIHVNLRRSYEPHINKCIMLFYVRLFRVLDTNAIRFGTWTPKNVYESETVIAWKWVKDRQHILVAINFSNERSGGRIICNDAPTETREITVHELIANTYYTRDPQELIEEGLHLSLDKYETQIFEY